MSRAQSTTFKVVVLVIIMVAVIGITWWLTEQQEPEYEIEPEWTKEKLYLGDEFRDISFVGCIYTDGHDNAVFYWDGVLHFIPEGGIFEYHDWEIKVVKVYRTPVSIELKWRSMW